MLGPPLEATLAVHLSVGAEDTETVEGTDPTLPELLTGCSPVCDAVGHSFAPAGTRLGLGGGLAAPPVWGIIEMRLVLPNTATAEEALDRSRFAGSGTRLGDGGG